MRGSLFAWIVATVVFFIVYLVPAIGGKFLPLDSTVARILAAAFWTLTAFALWHALSIGRRLRGEKRDIDQQKRDADAAIAHLTKHLDETSAELQGFKDGLQQCFVLDYRTDAGHIQDVVRRVFREQSADTCIVVVGSFPEWNGGPLSLKGLLSLRREVGAVGKKLAIFDTSEPFPAMADVAELIKADSNVSFHACHLQQVFDPVLLWEKGLLLALDGKCIVVPAQHGLGKDSVRSARRDLCSRSVWIHPEYDKKIRHFKSVLPVLSHDTLEDIKRNGYSFASPHGKMLVVSPSDMTSEAVKQLTESVNESFKEFSDEVLPHTSEVVANWPFLTAHDVSLIYNLNIQGWMEELATWAGASEEAKRHVRRFFYLNGDHRYNEQARRPEILLRGGTWTTNDRQTTIVDVIQFLQDSFLPLCADTTIDYRAYVVLVPSLAPRKSELDQTLRQELAKHEHHYPEMSIEKLATNWIVFGCQSWQLDIVQYEIVPSNGERDPSGCVRIYLYDDICQVTPAPPRDRKAREYLAYKQALLSLAAKADRLSRETDIPKLARENILPLAEFLRLYNARPPGLLGPTGAALR